MKIIRTTNSNLVALIDDEDFDRVSLYQWTIKANSVRRYQMKNRKHYPLANFIMGNDKLMFDHADRDFLNNTKENLRPCTSSQNNANKEKYKGNYTSKYKGVCWNKRDKIWRAKIKFECKDICIGSFKDEKEAADAYNMMAEHLFGKFAVLNNLDD